MQIKKMGIVNNSIIRDGNVCPSLPADVAILTLPTCIESICPVTLFLTAVRN